MTINSFLSVKHYIRCKRLVLVSVIKSIFFMILGNASDWKLMFDTNVIASSICSRETIKIMEETNTPDGHIINLNRYII